MHRKVFVVVLSIVYSCLAFSCQEIVVNTETLKPPVISNGRVDFRYVDTEGQDATITDPNGGAAIYYAVDGSDPTSSSTLYTGTAIKLTQDSTTIKAIAVKVGLKDSPVAEQTFKRVWKKLPSMPNVDNPVSLVPGGSMIQIAKKNLVAYGGYLYSVGGSINYGGESNHSLNACLRLEAASGTAWEPIDSLNVFRRDCASAVIDGKIYAIGGKDDTTELASVEVLDLSTASPTWATTETLGHTISGTAYAVYDGKVYMFGGSVDSASGMATHIYTPGSGLADGASVDMGGAVEIIGVAATANDRIYLFGGAATAVERPYVAAYIPATDSWDTSPADIDPIIRDTVAAGFGGKGYLFGGVATDSTSPTRVYNPVDNTWTYDFPLPQPRKGLTSTSDDTRIFLGGGFLNSVYDLKDDVWYFIP